MKRVDRISKPGQAPLKIAESEGKHRVRGEAVPVLKPPVETSERFMDHETTESVSGGAFS